jgi:succinate dehydrogenase/fumarate reductase flavoprotein subunit
MSTIRWPAAGPTCWTRASGRVDTIRAGITVLATGGLGQVYLRTTNPEGSRGDGLAMANRAGARVINCEYVQFHPTALYHDGKARFLVSEAVRGAGAKLLNRDGDTFMERYSPQWKDLAPRDEVARGIHKEMILSGATNVWLDLASALPADVIRKRFPMIHQRCLELGAGHHGETDSRGAGRPLFLRRGVDGPGRPQLHRPAVRRGRGGLHGAARGQPAGQRLDSRRPGLGLPGGGTHHGAHRPRRAVPVVSVADWEGPGDNWNTTRPWCCRT